MSIGEAIMLGLIDGLTEFLPISRTGHMSILNHLFSISMPQDGHLLFAAMLRLAALFSVCVAFWGELCDMGRETASLLRGQGKRRSPAARQLVMLIPATLPMLLRLPFLSGISRLGANSVYIGAAMVLTGGMLYVGGRMLPGGKTRTSITLSDAVLIGICQLVGSFPGLSRVGAATVGGIAVGLDKEYAVRFSLLLSIPVLLVSFVSSLVEAFGAAVDWSLLPAYLVGTAAAVLAGVAAIYLFRHAAKKGKFGGYAYYCWVAGVLSVILTMIF